MEEVIGSTPIFSTIKVSVFYRDFFIFSISMFDIHHNFVVKTPTRKVFEAFTTPQDLDSWWTLQSSGTPENGNVYIFYFGPEYDWRAEVVHVVSGKELTWKMIETMDDWKNTRVGISLKEIEGNTHKFIFFMWGGLRPVSILGSPPFAGDNF